MKAPLFFPLAALLIASTTTPALAQWSTDALSQPRQELAGASAGSLILFGGGYSDVVDIFDASTCTWSTSNLSSARGELAATSIGSRAFFGGGQQGSFSRDEVDIHDATTSTWTTATLSQARGDLAATSVAGKAIFAGGRVGTGSNFVESDVVDIYDSATDVWTTAQLSSTRTGLAATSVGTLALFAGGYSTAHVTTVDIYDATTNTWTLAELSQARSGLAATTAGNKAIFAGGSTTTTLLSCVDIYDASTGVWTTAELSAARYDLVATTVGDLALFAGGGGGIHSPSNVVDIYDAASDTWSTAPLSVARTNLAAASVANTAMFAGGVFSASLSDVVDVFRAPLGTIHCNGLPSSTGFPASLGATGSVFAGCNDVTLIASGMPAGQFAHFIGGQTRGMSTPPGSAGILCLAGNIGRFNQPTQIIQGPSGSIVLDLTAIPVNPPQAVQPGETWYFQCWFRDQDPSPTSNFTNGLSIVFN